MVACPLPLLATPLMVAVLSNEWDDKSAQHAVRDTWMMVFTNFALCVYTQSHYWNLHRFVYDAAVKNYMLVARRSPAARRPRPETTGPWSDYKLATTRRVRTSAKAHQSLITLNHASAADMAYNTRPHTHRHTHTHTHCRQLERERQTDTSPKRPNLLFFVPTPTIPKIFLMKIHPLFI